MQRALLVLASLAAMAPAHAASFDCAKARTTDERAVCASPRLSALDDLLAQAFAQGKASTGSEDALRVAHDFLADRKACGSDQRCILGASVAALGSYGNLGATVRPPPDINALTIAGREPSVSAALPRRTGQCTGTQVTSVTPRLGTGDVIRPEDFESGTAINFTNGGHQVSYEREPALRASRPGDRVAMCLIAVPHGCPPGDDRGRIYMVTNPRTGGTWMLPDSQHSCGGA